MQSRATNRLSAKQVRTITEPGMHHDGAGLYLLVGPTRSKSWVYRFRYLGHSHEMGLGPLTAFNLEEARERARRQRQLLADGLDPLDMKRQAKQDRAAEALRRTTFEQVAKEYLADQNWKSAKDAQIWPRRFQEFVYPYIGALPVTEVGTEVLLSMLRPIWLTKNETADRVRAKVESVLDFATVKGLREGDNPAAKKLLSKGLPNKVARVEHHEALPYAEVPGFLWKLRRRRGRTMQSELTALAVEWVILAAARYGEVHGATDAEIDWERRLWVIPAKRMKAGREHVVPLDGRLHEVYAMAAFRAVPETASLPQKRIFLTSDTAMRRLCRQISGAPITLHGFRSSFRDWCAENGVARDLAEAALAHTVKDKTEAAYNRTALVEQRRAIMERWADFCYGDTTTG